METNFTKLKNFDFIGKNDKIQVFYLEAPLSMIPASIEKKLASMMTTLNAYHTGIGFLVNNKSLIIDYTATYGMAKAMLPDFKSLMQNNLEWSNEAYIEIGNKKEQEWGNNEGYWKKSTYLTSINKSQFLELRNCILNDFLHTNPCYVFFGVKNIVDGHSLRESICDDLPLFVIKKLLKMGVEFNFLTYPYISRADIITKSPIKKLDVSKPDDKNLVVEFYKKLYSYIGDARNYLKGDILSKLPWIEDNIEELFTHIKYNQSLLTQLYKQLDTVILYSYDNEYSGKMCYYQIELNTIVGSYTELQIPRNVTPIEFNTTNSCGKNSYPKGFFKLKECYEGGESSGLSIFILVSLIVVACVVVAYTCYKCFRKDKSV